MTLEWEQVVIQATDSLSLGRWWAQALGWVVVNDSSEEFEIRPTADQLPGLLFLPVAAPGAVKGRLHLDFRPVDQQAEVARLLALGATLADVGQGEQPWTVMADPEGNVFCVLKPLTPAQLAELEGIRAARKPAN